MARCTKCSQEWSRALADRQDFMNNCTSCSDWVNPSLSHKQHKLSIKASFEMGFTGLQSPLFIYWLKGTAYKNMVLLLKWVHTQECIHCRSTLREKCRYFQIHFSFQRIYQGLMLASLIQKHGLSNGVE